MDTTSRAWLFIQFVAGATTKWLLELDKLHCRKLPNLESNAEKLQNTNKYLNRLETQKHSEVHKLLVRMIFIP